MPSDAEELYGSIRLPDGAAVRGRGVENPLPSGPLPDFGLYLGVDYEPTWESQHVQWPNYLLPRNFARTAQLITATHERARRGDRVEVACNAGKGRTGTVLACMVVLAGLPPRKAINWIRDHYDEHALRAPWQRWWVHRFATRRGL
jgi:hypothetical protein